MHEDDETLAFAVCLTRGDLRKLIDEAGFDLDAADADTQKRVLDRIAYLMAERHENGARYYPRSVPSDRAVPKKDRS